MPENIWNDYRRIVSEMDSTQELFPSMEYFNPKQFVLNYQIIRNSQLVNGKVINLDNKIQLPLNSILHLFDAVLTPNDITDTPDITGNILLNNEKSRKIWLNIKSAQTGDIEFPEQFRFLPANLPVNLLAFRREHNTEYFFIENFDSIPSQPTTLTIVNHNPVWRTRIRGGVVALQFYRKLQITYTSILNTIIRIATEHPDKTQFLAIPWGEEVYKRELFQRTTTVIDAASVKVPKSYQYLLMMQLFNYLANPELSIFAKLPDEVASKVVLIIGNMTDKCIFISLPALKQFTPVNLTQYRLLNQLNQLSLTLRSSDEAKAKLADIVETQVDDQTVKRGTVLTDAKAEIISTNIKRDLIANTAGISKEDKIEEIIAKSDKEIPISKPLVEARDTTIVDTDMVTEESEAPTKKPKTNNEIRRAVDTPAQKAKVREVNSQTSVVKAATVDTASKDFADDCDKRAFEFLDSKAGELTPKRIDFLKTKAVAYKSIIVDGKTVEEIINEPTDIELHDDILGDNVTKNPIDSSVRSSSLREFDRAYMERVFQKHMLNIVSSFRAQGIYLTNFKKERVANPVNDDTFYSCTFMDYRGKSNTVKFRLPNIDRNGRFKIDGVESLLLKQRINNPIVKISDTEVSLSSNYNKARIIRNTTVAHSFYAFIDGFLNSKKSVAKVTYGNAVIRDPVAYEYSTLCERYESIEFLTTGETKVFCSLYFNYPSRLEHFGGTEKQLAKYENDYGIYLGKLGTNLLFIDKDNFVTALTADGSPIIDFKYNSITDLCRLSLARGETFKKALTEWVTFRNLDINLPLIFVLAYRFGLRYILDDLNVDYTITENRTRVIVGGKNVIASQEMYSTVDDLDNAIPGQEMINNTVAPDYERACDRILRTLNKYDNGDSKLTLLAQNLAHCEYFRSNLSKPGYQERKVSLSELANYVSSNALPSDFDYVNALYTLGDYVAVRVNENLSKYNCVFSVSDGFFQLGRLDASDTLPVGVNNRIIHTDQNLVPLAGVEDYSVAGYALPKDRKYLYHVTYQYLGKDVVLVPRSTGFLNGTTENNAQKRISVSDNVFGAVAGSAHYLDYEQRWTPAYVYIIERDSIPKQYLVDYETLANNGDVEYVDIFRESWILAPAKFRCAGKILIDTQNGLTGVAIKRRTDADGYDKYVSQIFFGYKWESGSDPAYPNEKDFNVYKYFNPNYKLPELQVKKITVPDIISKIKQVLATKHPTDFYYCLAIRNRTDDVYFSSVVNAEDATFTTYLTLADAVANTTIHGTRYVYVVSSSDVDIKTVTIDSANKHIAHISIPTKYHLAGEIQITRVGYTWVKRNTNKYTAGSHAECPNDFTFNKPRANCPNAIPVDIAEFYALGELTVNIERLDETTNIRTIIGPKYLTGINRKIGTDWEYAWLLDYYATQTKVPHAFCSLFFDDGTIRCLTALQSNGLWYHAESVVPTDLGIYGGFRSVDEVISAAEKRYVDRTGAKLVRSIVADMSETHDIKSLPKDEFIRLISTPKVEPTSGMASYLGDIDNLIPATEDNGERRYKAKSNDIPIKFADRTIWINRYPLEHSLIIAGLDAFDLSNYQLSDFETKEVYYQLLMDIGKSINYLKGIDSFFDLFVDPITYGILKEMNEPTEVKGLLYRSAQLLATRDHRPAASSYNYRIRGYEQINAIIYNELARAAHKWQVNKSSANSFGINPEVVYLKLVTSAAVLSTDVSNPLQDVKMKASLTFAGTGGRSAESFVLEDRRFVADDIGIMAADTTDNQKVGMNSQLPLNAQISNTNGTLNITDGKGLSPADVLSTSSLVYPFTVHDDFKRFNMLGIQRAHLIPSAYVERNRVKTGYERVLAQYCSRRFTGVADKNGKVTAIDTTAQTVEVKYDDGTVDVFGYGEVYNEHESVCSTGQLVCNVKVGDKVKRGDIITYDKTFFTKDKYTNQVDFTTGVTANTVLMETDTTLEDAACISKRLSEKLAIRPVNTRVIRLSKNSVVLQSVGVGAVVSHTDKLMIFEEDVAFNNGDTEDPISTFKGDDETLELLGDLNKRTPTAKFAGQIVRIDAHYGGALTDMHPSLQRIVKAANTVNARRAMNAKGTLAEQDFPPPTAIPTGTKAYGVDFDDDTVVITFYIQEHQNMQVGDKCVLSLQLKHTISSIMPMPQYTGDGEEIDVVFSADALGRRIVLSPTYIGILNRILSKLESDCIKLYFG